MILSMILKGITVMKLQHFFRLFTLLMVTAACSMSMAAEPGWYAGGGIGYADVVSDSDEDDIKDLFAANGITATFDNDTENINLRITGGYWFNENVGVELSYITLGEADVEANITAPAPGEFSTDSEIDGFEYVVQFAYPYNNKTDITAKIGAITWDAEVDVAFSGAGGGLTALSAEDDGTDFTIGIGYARDVGQKGSWIWRGGYQYIDVDRVEHVFSSGFVYSFGK